jgi:acyl-[acyl-carrier-protein]-phospholipid O-acyltransferase/long-chain-fatty-acid--[acyl-carrier-protein] ligase
LKLFPKIKITIMEPQKIHVPEELVGRERRREIGKKLYDVMSKAMFEGALYNRTLFESIIEAAEQHGKKNVIIEDADHNKLTYRKILMGAFALGKKIAKLTDKGENVGIMIPNAAGTVVAFFATQVYGRVPAMLNFSTGVKNILSACHVADIKRVFTSRRFIQKTNLFDVVDALTNKGIEVFYLEDVRSSISFVEKVSAYFISKFPLESYKKINNNTLPQANDPAVVLFTSGSEGTPKGVVLSHANIQANIQQAASRVDFSSSDILFSALPIFHSFGLTGGFLLPIISGVKIFLYPSPLHYRIIPEVVYVSNATIMFGTDTFLSGYAKFAHPYDFFSVRYIFAGAEKLREETRKTYMNKFGIRIFEGYGATEASPIVSVNTPMHYKAGTVGRLLPNINYHLEKVKGIEDGGKLIISGPNIMLGYLKDNKPGVIQKPEYEINGKTKKGWYDTGDIVSVDSDGYLTIQGRVKRFAKIGGEMISLAAIEEVLYASLPEGTAHAVLNIPHPSKGEQLVLFSNDKSIELETIIQIIKGAGFSDLYIPKTIHILEEIPVLATGKVDFVSLSELAKNLKLDELDIGSEDN